LLAFFIYLVTLAIVEIAAGFVLNKILPDEEGDEFIQELPPIRIPQLGALAKKTGHRLLWFLKEAVPIFVIASVVLLIIDRIGVLGAMKSALSPIVTGWLGLPLDIVEVLILSLARHEAAAGLLLNMVDAGGLSYVQSIVAVVITTMFVPCFANIVAMCKQLGVGRGLIITVVINISSFILAGTLNWILIGAGL
jgi:ferrous iron transport protein B